MTGRKINNLLNLGAEHALYFHRGDWYHHLKRFPGILIDAKGYLKFDSEKDFRDSKNIRLKTRVNIYGGISSIQGYVMFSSQQLLKIEEEFYSNDEEIALRKLRMSNLIVRNRYLTNKLKMLYSNKCQICRAKIKIGKSTYYTEVHHIKPLGKPHNGPDIIENMICVCPNCHVLLDYNAIRLNPNQIVLKHEIRKEYIDYHNSEIKLRV